MDALFSKSIFGIGIALAISVLVSIYVTSVDSGGARIGITSVTIAQGICGSDG